jgi:uncharacterized OB-fold protein
MEAKEPDQFEVACPRCGGQAEWSFLDKEKALIAVMCQDCGRFQIPREEFDQAAVENAELNNLERGS